MSLILALSLAGTAYSLYANAEEAAMQKRAIGRKMHLLDLQAKEIEERGEINRELFAEKGLQVKASQQATFAKAGVDISMGVPLLTMANTEEKVQEQLILMKRETEYEAMAVRNEAIANESALGDIDSAATINSLGIILGGVDKMAYRTGGYTPRTGG